MHILRARPGTTCSCPMPDLFTCHKEKFHFPKMETIYFKNRENFYIFINYIFVAVTHWKVAQTSPLIGGDVLRSHIPSRATLSRDHQIQIPSTNTSLPRSYARSLYILHKSSFGKIISLAHHISPQSILDFLDWARTT